jgi:uncharacterized membrane protein
MSDSTAITKLELVGTVKEGVNIAVKNIGPILVNMVLWVLTCWIPYLNVGTTIGLWVGIVSKASKGEGIPFTEIFNPQYRKYMGEFFLTSGLIGMGVGVGMIFFIIPGIVISIAWSLSLLLVIDKGKNPSEAIGLSNQCTYGNKMRMFIIYFLVMIAFCILAFIFALIPVLGAILVFAASIFMMFLIVGLQASIYKQLTANV